jgi:hypothetical protein
MLTWRESHGVHHADLPGLLRLEVEWKSNNYDRGTQAGWYASMVGRTGLLLGQPGYTDLTQAKAFLEDRAHHLLQTALDSLNHG